MEAEFIRAKQLFIDYSGSTFQMHREGDYEEYKSYDVSKETEAEWIQELIDRYSNELSIRDWEAVSCLELSREIIKTLVSCRM